MDTPAADHIHRVATPRVNLWEIIVSGMRSSGKEAAGTPRRHGRRPGLKHHEKHFPFIEKLTCSIPRGLGQGVIGSTSGAHRCVSD